MNKELAGRLNIVFGDETKFSSFVEHLEEEEKEIHKLNLHATGTDLIRNQGKLIALNKLKTLRMKVRESLQQ